MRVVEKINSVLEKLMRKNKDLYLVGEDIIDPYGGAFKVTKGLSTKFKNRVLTTPISEPSIIGFSAGLALSKKKVVAEIMFGDFLPLTFDQIINHISKFIWVYNNIDIPLIIRTPMGGGRGYGSTHSQSLEKHFCGVSDINVIAINQYTDFDKLYETALKSKQPTIIIENKILYGKQIQNQNIFKNNPDIICVTYGGSVEVCVKSAVSLLESEEIIVEVYPVENLSPFNYNEVSKLSKKCKKFLFVEEANLGWGFNDMCKASIAGIDGVKFSEINGPSHPIPSTKKWEVNLMPNINRITDALKELFNK